jgi:hypothetical protein
VQTAAAQNVRWAHLIRNGVTTHAFDNSQRLVDLPIASRANAQITVTVPAQPTIAPPGWHMLFLVDHGGIPSVATWVHLT